MKHKKRFERIISYDMKVGIWQVRYRYLLAAAFLLIFILTMIQRAWNNDMSIQFWDILYSMFEGVSPYIPNRGNQLELPVFLIVFELLMFFIVGSYSKSDILGYGRYVFLAVKSRKIWWLSKCIWVSSNVLLYHLLTWGLLAGIVLIVNPSEGFKLSCSYVYKQTGENLVLFLSNLVCLPILTSIMIGLFQMLIGFIMKPVLGYGAVIALLVVSVYYDSVWFPGNYLMMLRNQFMVSEGVELKFGIIFNGVLIVFILMVGISWIRKKDILEGGSLS